MLKQTKCLFLAISLAFSENEVRHNAKANVGFGPTKEPERIGRAE